MSTAAAATGFAAGLSLIVAIGAQNAFVLRQGLLRQHVFWICLICAVSDAILVSVGVAGFGALSEQAPWLETVMRYGGAMFLIWYGFRSFRAAMSPRTMQGDEGSAPSLRAAILTCLALTWLNPHVYLDTVALLGAISSPYQGVDRWGFGLGAVTASFVFFFSLGYGARYLGPLFATPAAWRILDVVIGLVMWAIAAALLV